MFGAPDVERESVFGSRLSTVEKRKETRAIHYCPSIRLSVWILIRIRHWNRNRNRIRNSELEPELESESGSNSLEFGFKPVTVTWPSSWLAHSSFSLKSARSMRLAPLFVVYFFFFKQSSKYI